MLSVDFSKPGQPASGPIAQISCGRYIPESWPEAISFRPPAQLQVCCERGIAFVDLPGTVIWFDEAGRHMETIEPDYSVGEQLLMHFHRAVTSLVRKTIGLENAYQALRIVMMGRESVRCGHRLELAPRP
jgi:predicted dehydrogenase